MDLCLDCYQKEPTCGEKNHDMKSHQTARCGDLFHPRKADALQQAWGLRQRLGLAALKCDLCGDKVTQGWYYRELVHYLISDQQR